MQKFTSPFTISTPPLKAALLQGNFQNGVTFEVVLNIVNNANGTATLTVPATASGKAGVYKLVLETLDPDCCPRCGPLYWPGCPPSSFIGEDGGGNSTDGEETPTCEVAPPASTDPTTIEKLVPLCLEMNFVRGTDSIKSFTWQNADGKPFDLTTTSAVIEFHRKDDTNAPPAVVLTLSTAAGTVVLGKDSKNLVMTLSAAASSAPAGRYEGMLFFTLSDGRKLAFAEIELELIEV